MPGWPARSKQGTWSPSSQGQASSRSSVAPSQSSSMPLQPSLAGRTSPGQSFSTQALRPRRHRPTPAVPSDPSQQVLDAPAGDTLHVEVGLLATAQTAELAGIPSDVDGGVLVVTVVESPGD